MPDQYCWFEIFEDYIILVKIQAVQFNQRNPIVQKDLLLNLFKRILTRQNYSN